MISRILKTRLKYLLFATFIFAGGYTILTILYSFASYSSYSLREDYPVIIWWTPFIPEVKKHIYCANKCNCVVTKDRSFRNDSNLAAYLFYGSNFDYLDLPLPKGLIPWGIFHEESPKNLAFFLHKEGQSLFNITATFSRSSDFPVPLQFLRDVDVLYDTTYYVATAVKNEHLKELSPVLYIQSDCDTPSERDVLVRELMKFIEVDSYGTCLNNKKLPDSLSIESTLEDLYNDEFLKFVSQYKFTIAVENAICEDYITEKLWRPLIAGSVPIYLGSPTVKEFLPNNDSAILFNDYSNISTLANYLHHINSNGRLYEQHLQHKLKRTIESKLLKDLLKRGFYGIANNKDFPIPAFECFVCESIYENKIKLRKNLVYKCDEPVSRNTYTKNWWQTHWKIGKCQAKTLELFLEKYKFNNFTKNTFEEQLNKYLNNNNC